MTSPSDFCCEQRKTLCMYSACPAPGIEENLSQCEVFSESDAVVVASGGCVLKSPLKCPKGWRATGVRRSLGGGGLPVLFVGGSLLCGPLQRKHCSQRCLRLRSPAAWSHKRSKTWPHKGHCVLGRDTGCGDGVVETQSASQSKRKEARHISLQAKPLPPNLLSIQGTT